MRPLRGAYSRAVRDAASTALTAGERSVMRGLLPRVDLVTFEVDGATERWFLNLNRPEDLERAR